MQPVKGCGVLDLHLLQVFSGRHSSQQLFAPRHGHVCVLPNPMIKNCLQHFYARTVTAVLDNVEKKLAPVYCLAVGELVPYLGIFI